MKNKFSKLKIFFAVMALFIALPTIALAKKKISTDLEEKISNAQGNEIVTIHVRSVGSWTTNHTQALTNENGSVKKNWTVADDWKVVDVPVNSIRRLANRDDFDYFADDREVKKFGHLTLTEGADLAMAMGGTTQYNGTGIGIAVLDSGVYNSHDSFSSSRIKANIDFTGENRTDDPYGHGTHVASVALGDGDVSQGAYRGLALNANLINLRVLNSYGIGKTSDLLKALDWIYANRSNSSYNIKVVNMSLGTIAIDSYKDDPLCLAVRKLVDAGIVVVVAAGNAGKDPYGRKIYGLIHSPGIEPSAITVGAANSFGTDSRSDDQVTSYSSRGPTRSYWTDDSGIKHYDNLIKPDIVAVGNKIIAAESPNNLLVTLYPAMDAGVSNNPNRRQMFMSGTSVAAPVVAGVAVQMLQANPKLTPNMVKAILMYTAQQLPGFNTFEQGAGALNAEGAVRVAKLVRTDLKNNTALGANFLTTTTPPTQNSTIAGYNFLWSKGLIVDHSFAYGDDLLMKYQKVYGTGVIMGDGTVEVNGVLMGDKTMFTSGVIMGDSILTGSGGLISNGTFFVSTGVLMGDGVVMGDGVIMGDGVVMGDGVLMGDSVLANYIWSMANTALINGEGTAKMATVVDVAPPNAPTALTASAASASQINLSWTDNSTDESGFYIERSTDGANYTQIASVGANVRTYSNTGLARNTAYYYRVRAYKTGANSAYSNAASATTPR